MNRRSFVAAAPALFPAMAAGQEATPHTQPLPETLLSDLIQSLYVDRSISDAVALLSSDVNDQDNAIMTFAEIISWANDRFGDEYLVPDSYILTSEANGAVALFDLGDPRDVYVFLYIYTDAEGITGFRYSWTPY